MLTSGDVLQTEGAQAGVPAQQPGAIRGYGVVNTPAFTPGPDASPLMTWGDIGSTPIRLDQEDDIHVSTSTGMPSTMKPNACHHCFLQHCSACIGMEYGIISCTWVLASAQWLQQSMAVHGAPVLFVHYLSRRKRHWVVEHTARVTSKSEASKYVA